MGNFSIEIIDGMKLYEEKKYSINQTLWPNMQLNPKR